MRATLPPATILPIFLTCLFAAAQSALADGSTPSPARKAEVVSAARRNLEAARIELRLYAKVDYPLKHRQIERQIRLTEAELASYTRFVDEYRRFSKFSYSAPFLTTREFSQLAAKEAETRLEELKEEESLLRRFHSDRCRLYELKIEAAEFHLRSLESTL